MDFKNQSYSWEKFVVSESIIANHACASLVRREKIRAFILTTKSTKILSLENFPLYGMYARYCAIFSIFYWYTYFEPEKCLAAILREINVDP